MGTIPLYLLELVACQVLEYLHADLFPKSGVSDADRALLKEASEDHAAYRAHSGDGEVTWQARMKRSGILCFELLEDLVYGKKYDNGIKQAAKQGATAEHVFEQEVVKEQWQVVTNELQKEAEERKANAAQDHEEESETEEQVLLTVRKNPSTFPLHTAKYWQAVANQCVRTYVTLLVEPRTTDGVVTLVAQSPLKNINGTQGQDSVLTFLDMDNLGESQGPGAQPLLRKKYNVEQQLLRKLIHGAMLGRGSQNRGNNEATKIIDGDLIAIHNGFGHPAGHTESKNLFRLSTSKKDSDLDSDVKDVLVVYDDESIRSRKQRVRGSYSSHTCMVIASSTALTQCLPEKAYQHNDGYCTSNVINRVKALSPTNLWMTSRTVSINPHFTQVNEFINFYY